MHELILEGTVVAVAADAGHHFSKPLRDSIMLIEGHGVEDDAHAGEVVRHRYLAKRQPSLPNQRQVHLMRSELFDEFRHDGHDMDPGRLGDRPLPGRPEGLHDSDRQDRSAVQVRGTRRGSGWRRCRSGRFCAGDNSTRAAADVAGSVATL